MCFCFISIPALSRVHSEGACQRQVLFDVQLDKFISGRELPSKRRELEQPKSKKIRTVHQNPHQLPHSVHGTHICLWHSHRQRYNQNKQHIRVRRRINILPHQELRSYVPRHYLHPDNQLRITTTDNKVDNLLKTQDKNP